MYFRHDKVSHKYWSVELEHMFFYVLRPLIDRAPNPWESNHRDGPTGHNNNGFKNIS